MSLPNESEHMNVHIARTTVGDTEYVNYAT